MPNCREIAVVLSLSMVLGFAVKSLQQVFWKADIDQELRSSARKRPVSEPARRAAIDRIGAEQRLESPPAATTTAAKGEAPSTRPTSFPDDPEPDLATIEGQNVVALRDVYRDHDALDLYRARFGHLLVLPHGLTRDEFRRVVAADPSAALFEAQPAIVRRREGAAAEGERAVPRSEFQSFGFRDEGLFDVVVGEQLHSAAMPLPEPLVVDAVLSLAKAPPLGELDESLRARVIEKVRSWYDQCLEGDRQTFWKDVFPVLAATAGADAGIEAFYVAGRDGKTRISVFRGGDSAEVSELVGRLVSERRRIRAVLEATVGR